MSDQAIKERPAHQQRVLAERLDLAYKVDKLKAFIASEPFKAVADGWLLVSQLGFMTDYLKVLDVRISKFNEVTS